MKKYFLHKTFFARIIASILIITMMLPLAASLSKEDVQAAENSAVLRIISTTDTHAQGNFMNYDTGSEHYSGSLSQAYSLIKEARDEIKGGTDATVTVDCGDTIYGFASDQLRLRQSFSDLRHAHIPPQGICACFNLLLQTIVFAVADECGFVADQLRFPGCGHPA